MRCDNCRTEDSPAYTLRAHVDGTTDTASETTSGGTTVELRFCSNECLQAWT